MPDNNQYNIIYGFGYAKYIHNSNCVNQELEVFVPNEDAVKIGILRLNNTSPLKKKIRIVYYLKPVLGEDEIKTNGYLKQKNTFRMQKVSFSKQKLFYFLRLNHFSEDLRVFICHK
jgi:cellobiose phosphorylase